MAKARKKRARKREGLVHRHLERVSRDLLEQHPDVVRQFIGRNFGIYALYRKGKLYYVGLASGLAGRLKSHRKNRHGGAWDQFSIYLTVKTQHTKEIESLVLQIARPPGNAVGGKPSGSKDMLRSIRTAIREKQEREVSALFERRGAKAAPKKASSQDEKVLQRLLPRGARLMGIVKGRKFHARAQRDGRVRFGGQVYRSLSSAGKKALNRSTNGWWFWRVERGRGNWVRLLEIRRAGTPLT